jgi:tetratricopeptide (TPR) repeat protein
MTWVVLVAAAVLAGVAVGGVLRPFGTTRRVALERLSDPLEDERAGLLRSLRDLEDERASGLLAEEDYRELRTETEVRAVAVLRALEARDGTGELAATLRELRSSTRQNGQRGSAGVVAPERRFRVGPGVLVAAGVVAVAVAILAGSVTRRSADAPITGTNAGGSQSPLSFFEQRVREHPNDVAARLDLASRYLASGDAQDAIAQYEAALKLDPQNAEAHAQLGLILFRAGRAEDGLRAVNQALAVAPSYADALYFKGIILLQGMNQPDQAAAAFRSYLEAAPYGSHRAEVQVLLRQIQVRP